MLQIDNLPEMSFSGELPKVVALKKEYKSSTNKINQYILEVYNLGN